MDSCSALYIQKHQYSIYIILILPCILLKHIRFESRLTQESKDHASISALF